MNSAAASRPSVDVVIVNWNSTGPLNECLASIDASDLVSAVIGRVVVVDNASREFFIEKRRRNVLPLDIIKNPHNAGFAVACNQGAKACISRYILFLNPDVRLSRDSIATAVGWLEKADDTVGICGIRLLNDRGKCETSSADFPTFKMYIGTALGLDRLLPRIFPARFHSGAKLGQSGFVDQVSGAFFLVRRTVFDLLGGFDERFFVYYEEVDLSLRARRAGFRSYYLVEATACHIGGASTVHAGPKRLFYYLQSRLKYAKKHFRPGDYLAIFLLTSVAEFFLRTFRALGRGGRELRDTLAAYGMLWSWIMGEAAGKRRS